MLSLFCGQIKDNPLGTSGSELHTELIRLPILSNSAAKKLMGLQHIGEDESNVEDLPCVHICAVAGGNLRCCTVFNAHSDISVQGICRFSEWQKLI